MSPKPEVEPTWIDYLRSIDTPTLSNAIELLKVRARRDGFAPLGIRCLFPEFGRMCGFAVTAQVETISETEPFDIGRFVELYTAVQSSPKPAVVVLQEIGGYPDYAAHCGEVMSTVFTRLGAIGLVSDCGVRDLPEVRALGFHYFARGSVASHGSFRIVRTGVPVTVQGLAVRPGELLHGDENGLIIVPPGHEQSIRDAVHAVRRREGRLMEWVRSESFSLENFSGFVVE